MKIAIITRADDSSPKVLAQGLEYMLQKLNVQADVFYETGALLRLQSVFKTPKHKSSFSKRLYSTLKNYSNDRQFFKRLKTYDLIVFCECTPNGFWKNYYNIERLKAITQTPVVFYEVYYLGNAPTQIEKLKNNNDPLFERYDWHFSVSEVTEIRQKPSNKLKWSNIGLNLENTHLSPSEKKAFIALVDFAQPGYEEKRKEQIQILEELQIPYISLEKRYPMDELRDIYNRSALCFIQFPEAFGVPIAELLATGAHIFTPDSSWPMSWRLDENPEVHAPGSLPDVFKVYSDAQDLKQQLIDLRNNWHPQNTSQSVFKSFVAQYPQFYYGDINNLQEAIKHFDHD